MMILALPDVDFTKIAKSLLFHYYIWRFWAIFGKTTSVSSPKLDILDLWQKHVWYHIIYYVPQLMVFQCWNKLWKKDDAFFPVFTAVCLSWYIFPYMYLGSIVVAGLDITLEKVPDWNEQPLPMVCSQGALIRIEVSWMGNQTHWPQGQHSLFFTAAITIHHRIQVPLHSIFKLVTSSVWRSQNLNWCTPISIRCLFKRDV